MTHSELLLACLAGLLAAVLSAGLTWAIRPLMARVALARPNVRSSHKIPTPQGAGVAVIAATLTVAGAVIALAGTLGATVPLTVFAATLFIAAVGFADDMNSIPVLPRLSLQGFAVAIVIFAVPDDLRITAAVPIWLERAMLLVAGLWFVNLVNFMDGLDLMTAAEAIPVAAAVALFGFLGDVPASITIVASALCGAMLGFAPFNRPVAKIFLGDVGSLPIGLVLGWCLLQLAFHGQLAAALLLPLYYLADATVTLLRRLLRREPIWEAHRSHFYQRATDNGFTVWRVVGEVLALNILLAALAVASTLAEAIVVKILMLAMGCIAVAWLMFRFSRRR